MRKTSFDMKWLAKVLRLMQTYGSQCFVSNIKPKRRLNIGVNCYCSLVMMRCPQWEHSSLVLLQLPWHLPPFLSAHSVFQIRHAAILQRGKIGWVDLAFLSASWFWRKLLLFNSSSAVPWDWCEISRGHCTAVQVSSSELSSWFRAIARRCIVRFYITCSRTCIVHVPCCYTYYVAT